MIHAVVHILPEMVIHSVCQGIIIDLELECKATNAY